MVKKIKKIKEKEVKIHTDAEETVKKFVVLSLVIVLLLVGIYFVTQLLIDKRTSNLQEESTAGEVNYDLLTVGTLLNRPYDEYYVMVYNSSDAEAIYYSALITGYQQNKEAKKIYFCDLDNLLNKDYISLDGETNPKSDTLEELSFGKVTLLKIVDGKIDKAYESIDKIKEVLQ